METHGPISAEEASAALVSVRRSRTRVAWAGYPTWYWLGTAAALAVMPFATLVPKWVGLIGIAALAILGAVLVVTANRARGVCEYWTCSAMRPREAAVLYGPATVVAVVGSFVATFAWWSAILAAVLAFSLFAGTAFTLSARAARP